MRSIWKGAISFGLVTIPVKLYSATEERDVSFHQVRRSDASRIRYKRVAATDGEEVPYSEIAKGFELPSGEVVVLTDDDLADLPLTTSRTIEVEQFVDLGDVDPIYFAKSYYLEPDRTGVKPYVLLRDALEESGRVAIVKVALRQRESLALLRVREGVFVLETMLWPDEVRAPDFAFLDEQVEVRPQELAMATSLIDSLTGEFDAGAYTDSYREALQAVIEAKVAGREVVAPAAEADTGGAVLDLMAALRASVDAARRSRGQEVPEHGPQADDEPAARDSADSADGSGGGRRPAARKAPAKAAAAPEGATKGAAKKPAKRSAKAGAKEGAKDAAKGPAKTTGKAAGARARRTA